MIAAFLARFAFGRALAKLPWQLWVAVALIASLLAWTWFVNDRAYNRGFRTSDAQWVARVDAEVARQIVANAKALTNAQAEVERLKQAKEVRDATIERLNREAAEDPTAGLDAFGIDGVRRLNQPR